MTTVNVVGIDPGPVPGIVALQFTDLELVHVDVVQCSHDLAPSLLRAVLRHGDGAEATLVQIELFVVGRRSGRSSTPQAGQTTRDLIGKLMQVCLVAGVPASLQNASRVKAWASDLRLQKADLWRPTAGMRHARDAARHALFCAAADANQPDPLSKEWRSS